MVRDTMTNFHFSVCVCVWWGGGGGGMRVLDFCAMSCIHDMLIKWTAKFYKALDWFHYEYSSISNISV